MNKLEFNYLKKWLNKKLLLTVHIFYNLQSHPTFHSEERLVIGQLIKQKRVLSWSIYVINLYVMHDNSVVSMWRLGCVVGSLKNYSLLVISRAGRL